MNKVLVKLGDKEILFSNLKLDQSLCELHSFSFNYQIEAPNGVTLDTYMKFYEDSLDKSIEIEVNQKSIFEGIVTSIECINQFDFYIDFEIKGKCKLAALDAVKECKSFYKKKLSDIFKTLVKDLPSSIQPAYSEPLHYTVQYNVSNFEMLQMLCRREGEWMYYNGRQIVIKKPNDRPIQLNQKKNEVFNIKLDVKMPKGANTIMGYDTIKGNITKEDPKKSKQSNALDKVPKGKQFIAGKESIYQAETVPFEDYLKRSKEKYETQRIAGTVVLKGSTNNQSVLLGSIVEIMNGDKSEGTYVITKVSHCSLESSEYYNDFEAIPNTEKLAPYVDPEAKIEALPTYALVTQNEDKDGLSRIKVKFYWATNNEESCWMDLVTPHAGAGKGFRFLPEIDDEVIVDFYDNNVEAPYAIGAVYSKDRKDGVKEEGNHIKKISTKTNRRLLINDNDGVVYIGDSSPNEKYKGNIMHFEKKDDKQTIYLGSETSENETNAIEIDKQKGIHLAIKNGQETVEIKLYKDGDKIKIFAKEEILIHSEKTIKIKANDIELNANNSLKMSAQKIELNAVQDVKIEAKLNAEIKALAAKIEATNVDVKGDAMLNMQATGPAILKGAMVMIN